MEQSFTAHMPLLTASSTLRLDYLQRLYTILSSITTPSQPFYVPFFGTTRVSLRQNRTSGLYGTRED